MKTNSCAPKRKGQHNRSIKVLMHSCRTQMLILQKSIPRKYRTKWMIQSTQNISTTSKMRVCFPMKRTIL